MTGDKQLSKNSYLMDNRSLKTFPVALSMFMSDISAILILGNTPEIYLHGIQVWFLVRSIYCIEFCKTLIKRDETKCIDIH